MADEPRKLHIVMFPWLAFGHLIPYLELSKLIAQKGHRISFISTPRNIQRLPKLPPNLAPLIKYVSFALPHEDNLPQNAEATMDLPYHLVPYLKTASDCLQEPVVQFLETSAPDWIIYDFFPYWLPPIAEKLGISRAYFSIFSAWALSFFGSSNLTEKTDYDDPRTEPEHFTVPPNWVSFPTNVALRLYEAKKMFDLVGKNISGVSDTFRFMSVVSGCQVFLIRSCTELEPEWLKLLGELHQKPVIPVGLIPPSLQVREEDKDDDTWRTIVEWLDKQDKGTVVFIALGSEVTPSQQDFTELAQGLELSGLPFFWALRNRSSVELPDGFEERVKDRGVVWTSWAPQLNILSHDSVGGFLTHLGWSSIVEGIYFGRPLIMLPFIGDQGLNARVLEEKKVGIEIPRNEEDGSFTKDSVADSLRLVMLKEGEKIYQEKAKEMSKIFRDRELQQKYVDEFVDYFEDKRHMC